MHYTVIYRDGHSRKTIIAKSDEELLKFMKENSSPDFNVSKVDNSIEFVGNMEVGNLTVPIYCHLDAGLMAAPIDGYPKSEKEDLIDENGATVRVTKLRKYIRFLIKELPDVIEDHFMLIAQGL